LGGTHRSSPGVHQSGNGPIPERGNETLVRFEQWLATRIADLPDDGTSQLIERYATWQHLNRIRAKATDRSSAACRHS
ncbi:hypothetical protein O4162_17290, partial [Dietzia maris]|nr:hypothetical protein [Dietzia maris]